MSSDTLPEQPLVSVVIAAYNGAAYLREAIESALGQTYPHVEVVVVDDGSSDETPQIAQSYGSRVRYFRQQNAGTAAARNTGIRNARGELIALLDQDDRWLPEKLSRQVPLFQKSSRVGLVHSGGRVFEAETGRITSTYSPRERLDVHDLLEWCVVGCATTVFPRALVLRLGLFDAALPGADDWDMWIRIAAEHEVVGCPDVLVEIRQHPLNQGKNAERMYGIAARVVEKHSELHKQCPQCRRAYRSARQRVREDYYVKVCDAAAMALQQGKYHEALRLRLRALVRNPTALSRIPTRVLQSVRL